MVENKEEVLLNEDQWRTEAVAVIQDIQEHVQNIGVSDKIQSTNQCIYLNLTTVEGKQYCVELSVNGFRTVGNTYDNKTEPSDRHFETPYALLNHVSPSYKTVFGNSLLKKLEDVQFQDDSDPSV